MHSDKTVVLTFDYEVFLGAKTGGVYTSVIAPTARILDILKNNHARAIFFVDATWLLFIRAEIPIVYQNVVAQLKNIVKAGSSVELHLHPQWLDAIYKDGEVVFRTMKHYRLHSLSEQKIMDLFEEATDLLQKITGNRVVCFRAGGWCVEPFGMLRNAFLKTGIKCDMSVLRGVLYKDTLGNGYDYSDVPQDYHYSFNYQTTVKDEQGPFVEIPVSTYFNNPIYRIINKFLYIIRRDTIFGDGEGSKKKSFFESLVNLFVFSKVGFTLDRINSLMFKYIFRVHFRNSRFVVVVSHPKNMSFEGLKNLEFIVKKYKTINSMDLKSIL